MGKYAILIGRMGILTLAKKGLNALLNLVYPPACGICDKKLETTQEENTSICAGCLDKIKRNPAPYCRKCGRSLCGLTTGVETCWECPKREFYYERTWSGFIYEGVAKKALHLLKYSKKLSLNNLFCNLLIQFARGNPEILEGMNGVLAVPLYNVKFREREFNQAHLLAAAIVKEFNIKDLSACLKRSIATKPQSGLDKKERFENIKGTFEVITPGSLSGKNLLLIDDLFTTGATLNECAKVLKKAGAVKLHCLTFARGV